MSNNNNMMQFGWVKITFIIVLLFLGLCCLFLDHTVLATILFIAGICLIFGPGISDPGSQKNSAKAGSSEEPEAAPMRSQARSSARSSGSPARSSAGKAGAKKSASAKAATVAAIYPKDDPAEHDELMKCPFCGKEIPSDISFCFYCGKPLESYKRVDAIRVRSLHQFDEALENISKGTSSKECWDNTKQIRDLTDKILMKYAKEPEDRADYDRFVEYYLPKTAAAVEQYGILCTLYNLDPEQTEAKKNLDSAIDLLADAFTKIYNRLSTEGLFDISTDISALENILKLEGLTESDFTLQAKS